MVCAVYCINVFGELLVRRLIAVAVLLVGMPSMLNLECGDGENSLSELLRIEGDIDKMATTVLVVDDTAFMRMTLKTIIQKNGFEIIGEAADGEDAVAKYKVLRPDVVTMDITMPRMNGIEAVTKIMEMDGNAKIIICSAMGQKLMVMDALAAGAKDFLVKPFDPERIIESLKKVTSG